MKYLFAIVIALSGYGFAYALTVSGVVTDSEKKKPMPNVVVGIRELQIVTETNERGEFILADVPKGFYTLTFSHKEYGIVSMPIRVKRSFRIDQILSGKIYDSGTMVKAYKDTITSTGEQSITRQDIKTYPMRGMGDSTHLLQSLPGVGGGFSLATVPIIRGTNPLFNKYYIDDIPVDYPFHYAAGFVPIFSSINEEAIDTVSVVKGNAPIWTGDNLGNVIMIKSADAEKGGYNARMILDPIVPLMPTFSFSAVPYEDLSVVAAGRRSIVDLLFDMNKTKFYFSDYYIKAAYTLSTQHRITVTGTGAKDKVYFNDLTTESGYFANGVTWEYLVNNTFFVKTVVSNQNMKQAVLNSRDYTSGSGVDIKFNPDQYRLFQMATMTLKPVSIRAGYELIKYRNGCSGNMSLADIADTEFYRENTGNVNMSFPLEGHSLSGFAAVEGKHERAWYDAGVKYEYYSPLDEKAFSYNANIGYVINSETSIYAKHGRYFAHPDIQYYIGNLDPDFELAEARNFAVGTNVIPSKNIFLNAEIYYCRFYNLSPGTVFKGISASSVCGGERRQHVRVRTVGKRGMGRFFRMDELFVFAIEKKQQPCQRFPV
jgi:hypothetical protein